MKFDFLGQIFGKARRRAAEQDIAGLIKPTAVHWPVLGSRLAAAGAAYLVSAALSGNMPRDGRSAALLGAGALGAVVMAAPNAFQAAGILNAVSPGTISLAQAAGSAISTILSAPKAQKEQQIRDIASEAALAAVANWQNKTGMFTAGQLGAAMQLAADIAPASTASVPLSATAAVGPNTALTEPNDGGVSQ